MKKIAIKASIGKKEKGNVKELLGEATQYDSVTEALKVLKEESTLKLINRQSKTDALNALRGSARPPRPPSEPSLGRLVIKAPKEVQEKIAEILKEAGLKAAA